jgi:hypothetical protein
MQPGLKKQEARSHHLHLLHQLKIDKVVLVWLIGQKIDYLP